MFGAEGGTTGVDDDFIARGDAGIGGTIMGRNMFGPIRGAWAETQWTGGWGDNPLAGLLNSVMVAPITSSIRGLTTEV